MFVETASNSACNLRFTGVEAFRETATYVPEAGAVEVDGDFDDEGLEPDEPPLDCGPPDAEGSLLPGDPAGVAAGPSLWGSLGSFVGNPY